MDTQRAVSAVLLACVLTHSLQAGDSLAQSCVIPPAGIVAWWPGDCNASEIRGLNHGTLQNGAGCATGMVDQAFSFDGVDDYVTFPSTPAIDVRNKTALSADAWVNITSVDPFYGGYLLNKRTPVNTAGLLWSVGSDGSVFVRVYHSTSPAQAVSTPNAFAVGVWQHLAFTYNADGDQRIRMYADGIEVAYASNVAGVGTLADDAGIPLNISLDGFDGVARLNGFVDEVELFGRALSLSEIQAIFNAGSMGKCKSGSVEGQVLADCSGASTGLLGVQVDAFKVGSGDLAASAITDENGAFLLSELELADYTITLSTPLGYTSTADELLVSVDSDEVVQASFALTCIPITSDPRTIGYWKHQVGVATGGRGRAEVDATTLCGYLDLIVGHFNSNALNPVVVYQPPVSGVCSDKLQTAKELLNLHGSSEMVARARQQLLALLFNVAAGRLGLAQIVSQDDGTLSQAITFCDNLIDDPSGDHERAKTVADQINNGLLVAAGVIPRGTQNIAYRALPEAPHPRFGLAQNWPNPFNSSTTIRFTLPRPSAYVLAVYDLAGRLVRRFAGAGATGDQLIVWDGTDAAGQHVGSGQYVYQLRAAGFTETRKMLLTH